MLKDYLLPEFSTFVIQYIVEIIRAAWGKIIMDNKANTRTGLLKSENLP